MRNKNLFRTALVLLALTVCSGSFSTPISGKAIYAVAADKNEEKPLTGMQIYNTNTKGNCITCHVINDPNNPEAKTAGTVGPEMLATIKGRSRDDIRASVYDFTKVNPYTMMPPFERNKLLTKEEIEKVLDYIFSVDNK